MITVHDLSSHVNSILSWYNWCDISFVANSHVWYLIAQIYGIFVTFRIHFNNMLLLLCEEIIFDVNT